MGRVRHTPQTRARVIQEFLACGRVDLACERCGVDRTMHYDWLKKDSEYKAAFDEARTHTAQMLEDEAWRRAVEGVDKPVFQGGQQVGSIREYSDSLMTWLLRGLNAKRYGDRTVIAGDPDAPLAISLAEAIRQSRGKRKEEPNAR